MRGNAVLVHGSWSSPADWRWVEGLLAEAGVSVNAIDLVSHRRHDASRADDVAQVADAVAAVSGPTVVVGWSYGGSVMTDLEVDGLDVARLVFVSSIPGVPPSDPQPAPPTGEIDLSHIVFADDGTMVLDNDWFVTADPAVATMAPEVVEHLRAHPRRPVALAAVIAPQVNAAWRHVDTTVLLGRADELIPEPQRAWARDHIADVRMVDSDHFILFRQPRVIVEAITDALR